MKAGVRAPVESGIRAVQLGMLVNALLAIIKLVAGIVGNTYALVADAVESTADILASLVVWGGLRVASRNPDDEYPFGYGKAESLAAGIVSIMLLGAAVGIAIEAVREIRTPHNTPAPWTLLVLVGVLIVKFIMFRRTAVIGARAGSTAVQADAWHHASDAITSAAAFIGITIALWGGPGWEQADDWAALFASCIIFYNGMLLMRPALNDLMDRMPGDEVVEPVRRAAAAVPGVLAVEKLSARKAGLVYYVDIHVQADPGMSLRDSHELSGAVKTAIRRSVPTVRGALIHMEPFES
ncbi:MAG TPA: cation diffusion facilitator family transporter [Gemmatimonadaceae bacterium]|nr:cation diffusion facilitator family transporter [Gemmatimonadaceae bacterium]